MTPTAPDPFTADPEPRAMALILILVPAVWLGLALGVLL